MGCRITDNLLKTSYNVRHVEISDRGRALLSQRGISTMRAEEALDGAEVAILALPDHLIGPITREIEPLLKPGMMLVALDIAAALAGVLPERNDLIYFVTHPCHPSIFGFETDLEAQRDFFGGKHARQNIICSLVQGPEEAYDRGAIIARAIYAPVERAYRCTANQMGILEPVLSETVLGTCLTIFREALEEAIRRGVPRQAATDFLLGHLKIELAIVLELMEGATFSEGALQAIDQAKQVLFRPDWKKVFDYEAMMQSIRQITAFRR